ncbi:MAG: substrate-binding domain-containing protein [Candidatus Brocadiia bacterium]
MQRSLRRTLLIGFAVPFVAAAVLVAVHVVFWRGAENPLVVYCAHDSVYSESVLDAFQERTGIRVAPRFDTEATKSLGLIELLIREKDRPRADVFWNNELLGTLRLKEEGVLAPYRGSGWERIPREFTDPEGHWAGFGSRLRVWIVNTEAMQPTQEAVAAALEGDLSKVTIAKPLYGTTRTQYTVLWHRWGAEKLKEWHQEWRRRGVREVMGNAQVKDLVASGVCHMGLTDTDDFFLARDAGEPVEAVPVRLQDGSTICIPNTVCIIRGTDRPEAARRLVDYLLSEQCEVRLANARSRQVPLGPVPEASIPPEVQQLKRWAEDGVSLTDLGGARTECLAWLKEAYLE